MKAINTLFLIIALFTLAHCQAQTQKTMLEYKTRAPKTDIKKPPLLILLHGVGSNEDDLYQLADHLDGEYLIIFPRGSYTQSPGHYMWYDVDFSTGKPVINAERAEASRVTLLNFIDQLKEKHTFDENKVIVGGFSQGGIMSYSLGLTDPGKVQGFISLSGRMLEEIKPKVKADKLASAKALIIHGKADNVLPVNYARQAKAYLESHSVKPTYHEINLGHAINDETIQLMNKWLRDF
jgi:phospholipase/carboxylesterase